MRSITVMVNGVTAHGHFLEELAPKTCAAIRKILPIEDKGVHVQWSGSAWRTERDYVLPIGVIENKVDMLEPGDILYYPRIHKIAVCYGIAHWQGPERDARGKPYIAHRDVSVFARLEGDLTKFAEASRAVLFQGLKPITIREGAE